jgi:hypothetical protein
LITFAKGQRKDDVTQVYRSRFSGAEGIVVVGKAQEETPVFRTEKRRNSQTGQTYPWIVRSTAMVNHYYFYAIDADFGPFFLRFCTYFPYNANLCINGHEHVKRQLAKEGIGFQALDNGILSCTDPRRLQQLCDGLPAHKIGALLRKWLARVPHPFIPKDRAAGYRYAVSILQAEFSLTQVLDRPQTGRVFFEEVIREKPCRHYGYYGVTGNSGAVSRFLGGVEPRRRKWPYRTTRTRSMNWLRLSITPQRYPLVRVHTVRAAYRHAGNP